MGKPWTLFFGGSKITPDDDWSHEIKRHLLLGRKAVTNLDSIDIKDITLPTNFHYSQNYDFSSGHVWMWELDYKESLAPNSWCFWTTVLEKTLLRVPWTARSNQSILKEISPKYSLEGLMLKLKLQYLGHLMRRTESLEKTFMLGKIEGGRRRGCQEWDGWMATSTQWTWVWANSGRWWRTGKPGMLQFMALQRVRHDLVTKQQQQQHMV